MTCRILIVDDDPVMRFKLQRILTPHYDVRNACSGEEALAIADDWSPDMILLDVNMPGIDGYETCRRIKTASGPPPQVTMVSGNSASQELALAFEAGADDYLVKPVNSCELLSRVRLHMRLRSVLLASSGAPAADRLAVAGLETERHLVDDVHGVEDVAVFALSQLATMRDNETGDHLWRLRDYAMLLGRELQASSEYSSQIDDAFLDDLYRAGPLHDIGKVGIPDSILLKTGRLTPREFEAMKGHTVIGATILEQAAAMGHGGFLRMAADVARYHHERWDGTGYPNGLAKFEIPLAARIVAVADVYDALTSDRPYKTAWPSEQARDYIAEWAGSQFDPVVAKCFIGCFNEILRLQIALGEADQAANENASLPRASLVAV